MNPARKSDDLEPYQHDPWYTRLRAIFDATGKYGIPIIISIWLIVGVTVLSVYLVPHLKDYLVAGKDFNVKAKDSLEIVLGEVKLMRMEYDKQQATIRSEYSMHEADHIKVSEKIAALMEMNLTNVRDNGDEIKRGNELLEKAFQTMAKSSEQRDAIMRELIMAVKGPLKNEQPPTP